MKKNYFLAASLFVSMVTFGQVGNSLRFDGIDDRVVIPSTTQNSVNIPSTFEVNIFVDAATTAQIIAKYGWTLKLNSDNSITFYIEDAPIITSDPNAITLNTWHHIAGVADGTNNTLYINGVSAGTAAHVSTTIPSAASGDVVLGTDVNFTGHFAGALDEVRIWNVARTATQIAANKNSELGLTSGERTGLVAYYQFNQGIAGGSNPLQMFLSDTSGNSNPGAITNFTKNGNTSNFVNTTILPTQSFAIDSKMQIYPNPATNEVTINHNDLTNVAVKVTDISGKLVINQTLNQTSSTVSISDLNAGVYLFTITSNEGQTTKKIVKQ
jgi:hypothetical protein